MNVKKIFWHFLNGTASAPFVEPTQPDSGIILKFNFWSLSTLFQERSISPSGVPITASDTVTDPVGTILDQSRACTFLRSTGATAIPTLGADGILFDGTNDQLEVPNSTVYLKRLHAANTTFGIRFKIKKTADVADQLFGTMDFSSTLFGFIVMLTAGNKLQFYHNAGAANNLANYTSTKSILAADGIVTCHINVAAGVNGSSIRIGGTTETFTDLVANGATNSASTTFKLGGVSTFFGGQFCEDLEIRDTPYTALEMAAYEGQTTARSTEDFTMIKQWQLDFWDSTKCFSDSGGTVPVTNGSVTRKVNSSLSIPADTNNAINRGATAASDAAAPLWDSDADGNGNAAIQFAGDGVKLLTYGEDLCYELGGTYTLLLYFRNDDADKGSHLLTQSPDYGVLTGDNYPSGPYFVTHQSLATEPTLGMGLTGINIIGLRRRGNYAELFNRTGVIASSNNFGKIGALDMGSSTQGADWYPHGPYFKVEKYFGWMPDTGDSSLTAKLAIARTDFDIPNNLS